MNINSLLDRINSFKKMIEGKGYFRDIQGFSTTLSQPNTSYNIILLNDIVDKLNIIMQSIYQSSIPDDMIIVLPNENNYQFINKKYNEQLIQLKGDTQITPQELHKQLVSLINDIKNHINNNISSISKIEEILLPYYKVDNSENQKTEKAILAVVFNNKNCYQNMPSLIKTLSKWNKLFQIYSQLIKSDSPEDIEIVSVHDGSLDFIFNFNIELSINLTEVVKFGLIALSGFFAYIKAAKPIIDSYLGNKELIDLESKRKELLLNNVYEAIASKISEQHKISVQENKSINQESVDKKIDEVSKIIADHLIGGNEIKLLTFNDDANNVLMDEVKEKSQIIKNDIKSLNNDDILLLENKYKMKDEP